MVIHLLIRVDALIQVFFLKLSQILNLLFYKHFIDVFIYALIQTIDSFFEIVNIHVDVFPVSVDDK